MLFYYSELGSNSIMGFSLDQKYIFKPIQYHATKKLAKVRGGVSERARIQCPVTDGLSQASSPKEASYESLVFMTD